MMSAHGRTTRQNGVTISPPGSTSTNKFLPLPGTRNRLDLPTGCRSVSVRGGTAASVTLRDLAARAAHPVLRPTLVLIVDIRTIVLYSAAPVFGNLHLPCQQKTAFTQYGNQIRLATRPRWGRPMDAAAKHIAPQAQRYQRRRPEKTLWYRTVQSHFETWLALSTGQDDASPPAHVEQAFRRYLECGILAHGFSLDASVCIGGADRAGLERLLRYCARPPSALEHLHPLDAEHLIYHNPKPRTDSPRDLVLTPLELIGRIAALVPPPRAHRHRYYGVLAPNQPMRAAVTALAPMPVIMPPPVAAVNSEDPPPRRAASHYLWAMLLARIYEALPLVCPVCQTQMRIIAFITDAGTVRKILDHIGESAQPPTIAPARGPPLWEIAGQAGNAPQWDMSAQPAPGFEFDQRIAW